MSHSRKRLKEKNAALSPKSVYIGCDRQYASRAVIYPNFERDQTRWRRVGTAGYRGEHRKFANWREEGIHQQLNRELGLDVHVRDSVQHSINHRT